jgi:hypothetical protein
LEGPQEWCRGRAARPAAAPATPHRRASAGGGRGHAVMQPPTGEDCATFTNIFGASICEATMRLNPKVRT